MKRSLILLAAVMAVAGILAACAPAAPAVPEAAAVADKASEGVPVPDDPACIPTQVGELTPVSADLKVLIVSEDTEYKNKSADKIADVLRLYEVEPVIALGGFDEIDAAAQDAIAVMWRQDADIPADVQALIDRAGDATVIYLDTEEVWGTASEAVIRELGITLRLFYPKQC